MQQKLNSVLDSEGTFHSTQEILKQANGTEMSLERWQEIVAYLKWQPFNQTFWRFWEENQVEGKFTFRIVLKIWVYLTSLSFTCLIIMNEILQMPVWKNSSYNFLLNLYLRFS